jgi:hypothetical protein
MLKSPPTEQVSRLLYATVVAAIVFAVLVFGTYFVRFGLHGALGDQAIFGQFGDYIGGLLNPILSFVTLLTLLWSLRTQSAQLLASNVALEQAHKLHGEQLQLQRDESTREQLKADFDHYIRECESLLAKCVFRISTAGQLQGMPISLNDLYKNPVFFGCGDAANLLRSIPAAMKRDDALALHLNELRTQLSFAVYSACNLIQYLSVSALRHSTEMRLRSLVSDVRGVHVISSTEEFDFLVSLVGAMRMVGDQSKFEEHMARAKNPD